MILPQKIIELKYLKRESGGIVVPKSINLLFLF